MNDARWSRDPRVEKSERPDPEREPQSERSVTHYREIVWTARMALLFSILSLGLAVLCTIVSLISLYCWLH
jgi:hypothetical protein